MKEMEMPWKPIVVRHFYVRINLIIVIIINNKQNAMYAPTYFS